MSRIFLDADTAARQQQALCHIMSDFLGERRLPYLVLDSRKVLRDRTMFSARGAGILGFALLGSRTCYALDENMELDLDGVRAFLERHRGERIFLFGFTFMIWKHVIRALEEAGERLSIPDGILVHGGGWKKLAGEAVSPEEFKARVAAATGVAGPDPDERGNPVGLVYLALAAPDGTWVRKIQQGMGRERVRHVAASHAFDLARRYLSGLEMK